MLNLEKDELEKILGSVTKQNIIPYTKFAMNLVSLIGEFIDNNSTQEENLYNNQYIIEYQDFLNKQSIRFKDTNLKN